MGTTPPSIEEVFEYFSNQDFFCGLPVGDWQSLRKVMALIHYVLTGCETAKSYDKYSNWRTLPRSVRQRVRKLLEETKGNYLLYSLVHWLAKQHKQPSKGLVDFSDTFKKYATFYARNRRAYYTEWRQAKAAWIQFLGHEWNLEYRDADGDQDPTPWVRDPDHETQKEQNIRRGVRDADEEKQSEQKKRREVADPGLLLARKLQQRSNMQDRESTYDNIYVKHLSIAMAIEEVETDDEKADEVDPGWNEIGEVKTMEGRTRGQNKTFNEVTKAPSADPPATDKPVVQAKSKRKSATRTHVEPDENAGQHDNIEEDCAEAKKIKKTQPEDVPTRAKSTRKSATRANVEPEEQFGEDKESEDYAKAKKIKQTKPEGLPIRAKSTRKSATRSNAKIEDSLQDEYKPEKRDARKARKLANLANPVKGKSHAKLMDPPCRRCYQRGNHCRIEVEDEDSNQGEDRTNMTGISCRLCRSEGERCSWDLRGAKSKAQKWEDHLNRMASDVPIFCLSCINKGLPDCPKSEKYPSCLNCRDKRIKCTWPNPVDEATETPELNSGKKGAVEETTKTTAARGRITRSAAKRLNEDSSPVNSAPPSSTIKPPSCMVKLCIASNKLPILNPNEGISEKNSTEIEILEEHHSVESVAPESGRNSLNQDVSEAEKAKEENVDLASLEEDSPGLTPELSASQQNSLEDEDTIIVDTRFADGRKPGKSALLDSDDEEYCEDMEIDMPFPFGQPPKRKRETYSDDEDRLSSPEPKRFKESGPSPPSMAGPSSEKQGTSASKSGGFFKSLFGSFGNGGT